MPSHEFTFDVLRHPPGLDALSTITFEDDVADRACLRVLNSRAYHRKASWKERASIRVVRPTDLGLSGEHGVRTDAIFAAATERGLQPCADEVCLCLYEQCPDLLSFSHCIVAMDPVLIPWRYNGPTKVDTEFCLGHQEVNGAPQLGFATLRPWGTDMWKDWSCWVFELTQS